MNQHLFLWYCPFKACAKNISRIGCWLPWVMSDSPGDWLPQHDTLGRLTCQGMILYIGRLTFTKKLINSAKSEPKWKKMWTYNSSKSHLTYNLFGSLHICHPNWTIYAILVAPVFPNKNYCPPLWLPVFPNNNYCTLLYTPSGALLHTAHPRGHFCQDLMLLVVQRWAIYFNYKVVTDKY